MSIVFILVYEELALCRTEVFILSSSSRHDNTDLCTDKRLMHMILSHWCATDCLFAKCSIETSLAEFGKAPEMCEQYIPRTGKVSELIGDVIVQVSAAWCSGEMSFKLAGACDLTIRQSRTTKAERLEG